MAKSTYVYRWIDAYVRRYFANHSRNVRIPVHVSEAHHTLTKQVEKLSVESVRDVASMTDSDISKLSTLQGWSVRLATNIKNEATLKIKQFSSKA